MRRKRGRPSKISKRTVSKRGRKPTKKTVTRTLTGKGKITITVK